MLIVRPLESTGQPETFMPHISSIDLPGQPLKALCIHLHAIAQLQA